MKKILKFLYDVIAFLVYNSAKLNFYILSKLLYSMKVIGEENIPKTGGIAVAANHTSYLDPPIAAVTVFKRKLLFMARDTLFENIWGVVFGMWGAFPIKRGAIDRKAWGTFERLIKEGNAVLFFPEGTRSHDGELQQGKPGAGMLIYNAKAVVLPIYIEGAFKAYPRTQLLPGFFTRLTAVIGEPLHLDEYFAREGNKELYTEITVKIMEAIRQVKEDYLKGLIK